MVLIGMRWQHGDGTWHYHGTTAHQHDCQGLLQADAAADVAKCIEYRPGVAKLELSEATNKRYGTPRDAVAASASVNTALAISTENLEQRSCLDP